MKIKSIIVAAIMAGSVIFVGCEGDSMESNVPQSTSSESANPEILSSKSEINYSLHNGCLAALINDIDQNYSTYSDSPNPLNQVSFFVENFMQQNMSEVDDNWISQFYDNYETYDYRQDQHYINVKNSEYYAELTSIIDNNTEVSVVNSQILALINTLKEDNNIGEIEKIALESAMRIGMETFEYWTNNDAQWTEVANEHFGEKNSSFVMRNTRMMHADIEGAISGAITGAFTGGPFGAAVGAMLGAAWGSAVSGAIDHFGWW